MASEAATKSQEDTGVNIMIAGLVMQVVSLLLFIALCTEFALRCSRRRSEWDPLHETLRNTFKFRAFLFGMLHYPVLLPLTHAVQPLLLRQSPSSFDPPSVWPSSLKASKDLWPMMKSHLWFLTEP